MEFAPLTRRQAIQRLGLLLGGAVSAPVLSGILGGCRAEPGGAGYTPQALSQPQFERIAVISDRIIPPTDTPGAREAGVPEFIDEMLHGWMSPEDRQQFLAGLDALDARAQADHGGAFLDLPAEQQVALLEALDREAYAPAPEAEEEARLSEDALASAQQGTANVQEREQQEVGGDPLAQPPPAETAPGPESGVFFRQLKELTLAGYYTSQIGMTQELQWLASPGRYDGDIPLSQVGRAWA